MDKVVIITGGSSGIGKACAFEFGKNGFKVVITGRNAQPLEDAKTQLESAGIQVLALAMDVSKMADNQRMVEQTLQAFGSIDVLINNAGISMRALFKSLQISVIEQLMEINFMGTVYATKCCLPHIIASKGSILGISSIAGIQGLPGRTGYSASKFAVHGFLESLRLELEEDGVHVGIICPGFTASNIRNAALQADGTPQKNSPLEENKLMAAEKVAEAIFQNMVQRAPEVILTTQGKLTVFLKKFFPAFLQKQVLKHFQKEKNSPF